VQITAHNFSWMHRRQKEVHRRQSPFSEHSTALTL
jgi:hypothetical protein